MLRANLVHSSGVSLLRAAAIHLLRRKLRVMRRISRVQEAKSACENHGDHDHESSFPARDGTSHHLCVATHLFYLAQGDADSLLLDLSLSQAVLPRLETAVDQRLCKSFAAIAGYSVRPPAPQRQCAVLGVWVI